MFYSSSPVILMTYCCSCSLVYKYIAVQLSIKFKIVSSDLIRYNTHEFAVSRITALPKPRWPTIKNCNYAESSAHAYAHASVYVIQYTYIIIIRVLSLRGSLSTLRFRVRNTQLAQVVWRAIRDIRPWGFPSRPNKNNNNNNNNGETLTTPYT